MEWLAAGLGLFDAGMSMLGISAQEKADKRSAELGYKDDLEKIRRRAFEQEQVKGEAIARSEASGVLHTGGSSAQGFLDTMAREFEYELDWMKSYAKESRSLRRKGAEVRAQAGTMDAISGGISTGLNIYNSFG